jgi:hypothetical protein
MTCHNPFTQRFFERPDGVPQVKGSVTQPRDRLVQGPKIKAALPFWRRPRFSHSAVNDVSLNSLASWARKYSQVLARHARLNRRQPHGRTTSGALRTLVLCVEHGLLLRNQRSTGRPAFASEPASRLGLDGSDAMTLISTRLHLGHSNNRCSKPTGPGEMRSSIIRVWQCEQRRRSIAVRDCGDEGTMRPLSWARALPISLSPITACSDGDGANLAQYASMRLVNIDHY